ncbi:hypothetical protein [Halomonas sp. HAL1]|uniref:hypothetical protein n=1 Tax=Halomonas sp. HAL1 TaxID=550984 RepID=UPI00022D27B3|nr:hypothetical protein [Halomonas sp. HAL1]EHA15094.1 hypothetical protein HAL1_13158 [Halomonas sp. HAL1]WKV94167.1 hypothetical protein Q3Y66_05960 [Halomonas sp. HAL1]
MLDIKSIEELCNLVSRKNLSSLLIKNSNKYSLKILKSMNGNKSPVSLAPTAEPKGINLKVVTSPAVGLWVGEHPGYQTSRLKKGDLVRAKDIVGYLRIKHILLPVRACQSGIFESWMVEDEDLLGFDDNICNIIVESNNETC